MGLLITAVITLGVDNAWGAITTLGVCTMLGGRGEVCERVIGPVGSAVTDSKS
jgi:hypothetical protein